jgi:hypothetical protein
MVGIVKPNLSIAKTFYYNQHKVEEGKAECLMAANYPVDFAMLSPSQRLAFIERTAATRPTVIKNAVHITLNFSPGEQIGDELMKKITEEFMEDIGFGKQPYLVFRHDDAAHPHLHIVTTRVTPQGENLDMNFIGELKSRPSCDRLEEKYGLIKAKDHPLKEDYQIAPVKVPKAGYNKADTRRQISNVLSFVFDQYKFTSLGELNAILNLYNVNADAGAEGSRMREHKGLMFHLLDEDGKQAGVAVKASTFPQKATLSELEKKFRRHRYNKQRADLIKSLSARVDLAILKMRSPDLAALRLELKKDGIDLLTRFTPEGRLYATTFIDHRSRLSINGSALGKDKKYSAASIAGVCGIKMAFPLRQISESQKRAGNPHLYPPKAPLRPSQHYYSMLDRAKELFAGISGMAQEELNFFYGFSTTP